MILASPGAAKSAPCVASRDVSVQNQSLCAAARPSESNHRHEIQRNSPAVPRLLQIQGSCDRAVEPARARQRSDAAFHQFGHGAVSYTHLTLPTSDLV